MIWIRVLQHYRFSDLCFDFLHRSFLFLPPDEFNFLFSESSDRFTNLSTSHDMILDKVDHAKESADLPNVLG